MAAEDPEHEHNDESLNGGGSSEELFDWLEEDMQADLDRQYVPFPEFAAWAPIEIESEAWDAFKALRDSECAPHDDARITAAHNVVLRTAAFDTGALEDLYRTTHGITMSVAYEEPGWQQDVESSGGGLALDLFDAQLRTYSAIRDATRDELPDITEAWIRDLHKQLCGPQETYVVYTKQGRSNARLQHGEYKTNPNHVRKADGEIHTYAPVSLVAHEMRRLVLELRSEALLAAHPVLQAAYAHYSFITVHPFADGNGRVARALASVYFYRALSLPLTILLDQRREYLTALQLADQGAHHVFAYFLFDRAADAVMLLGDALRRAPSPTPADVAARLNKLVAPRRGLTPEQLDAKAAEALAVLKGRLTALTAEIALPSGVSFQVGDGHHNTSAPLPEGYRYLVSPSRPSVNLSMKSVAPTTAEAGVSFGVVASRSASSPIAVVLLNLKSHEQLPLRLSEIGADTPVLAVRLQPWVEQAVAAMMAEFETKWAEVRRRVGYEFDP